MRTIILPKSERLRLQGRWVHCANGVNLPPPMVPVPIALQSRSGLQYTTGLWYCALPVQEDTTYTLEDILAVLDRQQWSTITGATIPRQPYAWFVVPTIAETTLFVGDL
jgi:hypothetical protein